MKKKLSLVDLKVTSLRTNLIVGGAVGEPPRGGSDPSDHCATNTCTE